MSMELLPDPPAGVRVSVAKPEDHRDVLNIMEVYEGLDYLDFTYPYYMANPDVYCYILYLHKKAVAFVIRFVVDGGQTVVSGAGRTHPSIQGQGMMHYLLMYADHHIQNHLPKPADRLVYTAYDSPELAKVIAAAKKSKGPNRAKVITMKRQIHSFKSTKGEISKLVTKDSFRSIADQHTSRLWRPDKAEYLQLIMDPTTIQELFPDNQLIVFFEPYRPKKTNFEYIHGTSAVFISGSRTKCQAVSFITQVLCKRGLRYDFEFYGPDTNAMLQHLCNYLHHLTRTGFHEELIVEMVLFVPLCIDVGLLQKVMGSWGMEPGNWSHHSNYVLVQVESKYFPAKL